MWRGRTSTAPAPASVRLPCRSTWHPRACSISPTSSAREVTLSRTDLVAIPVVDVRDGGPLRHAVEGRTRARALRDDCLAWFPRFAHPALPLLDGVTRRWLKRSRSPYVAEIAAIAEEL